MSQFQSFGLPSKLLERLDALNFTQPTPIQEQAIPVALEGCDILGSAQTGTGKTMAFGIPLVAKLLNDPDSAAMVITPTRELATQVMDVMQKLLGRQSPVKTALLIGGESIEKQFRELRAKPRLFVGTPGRINDHISRRLKLDNVNFLVLDETDRMLDMGFSVQIKTIVERLSAKRQTLLFSATLPRHILKLAASYQNQPKRIELAAQNHDHKKIKQSVTRLRETEKFPALLSELEARDGSVIIFVKTKHGADRLARRLSGESHDADAIHGNLRHNKRERVIKAFRQQKYRILVATDVASRGLDVPHIQHVINYDLPQCPEDYVHRIGRTARAGAEGSALCFVTPADRGMWSAIERIMNPDAKREPRHSHSEPRHSHGEQRHGKPSYGKPSSRHQRKPTRAS